MEPLISVIVPVYNVEEYVECCVRSITNQTYKNLEIILVDDGSPDKSGEICDRLAEEDERITVYHKKNGGLSDARNYGTSKSNGEYIAYIDSDDAVAENYFEYLFALAYNYEADISCCNFKKVSNHEIVFDNSKDDITVCAGDEACKIMLSGAPGKELQLSAACGKIYKREIINLYKYPVGREFEDTATTYKYLYSCKKIAIGSKKLYMYFKNEAGIISKSYKEKNYDRITALIERAEFFEEKEEKQLAKSAWKFALRFLYADSYANDDRCVNEMKEILRSKWIKGYIPFDILVRCSAYLVSPKLYRKIRASVLG